MLNELLYIIWNPSDEIFHIGNFAIRWYAMCWLVGLILGYYIVKYLYKHQKIKPELFEPLFIYCFLGILIGARLGHCLFYDPGYFLSSWQHVVEMIIPIRFEENGDWHFMGYAGLASHGGAVGLIAALWLYSRNMRIGFWTVMDNIGIATPVTACFIRLGNLMNSEIVGKVTDVPWAFIFQNAEPQFALQPRHPGQLYEAIAYAIFFFVLWYFYRRSPQKAGTGFFIGLCMTLIFTFRFFIEYTKEIQVSFEAGMPLDMGQLLSIPFIIIGIACMVGGKWMKRLDPVK